MKTAAALVLAFCLSAIGPSEQFRLPWTKNRQWTFEDFERETGLAELGDPLSVNREVVYVGAPDGAKFAAYREAAGNPPVAKDEVDEPLIKKSKFVYDPDHEDDIRGTGLPQEPPVDGEYPIPPDAADISDSSRRVSIPEWWLTKPGKWTEAEGAGPEEAVEEFER